MLLFLLPERLSDHSVLLLLIMLFVFLSDNSYNLVCECNDCLQLHISGQISTTRISKVDYRVSVLITV